MMGMGIIQEIQNVGRDDFEGYEKEKGEENKWKPIAPTNGLTGPSYIEYYGL